MIAPLGGNELGRIEVRGLGGDVVVAAIGRLPAAFPSGQRTGFEQRGEAPVEVWQLQLQLVSELGALKEPSPCAALRVSLSNLIRPAP